MIVKNWRVKLKEQNSASSQSSQGKNKGNITKI